MTPDSHLNPVIPRVPNDDESVCIAHHSGGVIELAWPITFTSEGADQSTVRHGDLREVRRVLTVSYLTILQTTLVANIHLYSILGNSSFLFLILILTRLKPI